MGLSVPKIEQWFFGPELQKKLFGAEFIECVEFMEWGIKNELCLNLWLTDEGLQITRADAVRFGKDDVHRAQVKRRGYVLASASSTGNEELWVAK